MRRKATSRITTTVLPGLVILFCLSQVSCSTSTRRVKRYLDVQTAGTPTEAQLSALLLHQFPIGTQRSTVISDLEKAGIQRGFKDRGNSYTLGETDLICRFRSNGTFLVPATKYGHRIRFIFEKNGLKEIAVSHRQEWP